METEERERERPKRLKRRKGRRKTRENDRGRVWRSGVDYLLIYVARAVCVVVVWMLRGLQMNHKNTTDYMNMSAKQQTCWVLGCCVCS